MTSKSNNIQQAAMKLLVDLSHAPHDGEKLHPERLRAICAVGHNRGAFIDQINNRTPTGALTIPKRSDQPALAKPVAVEPAIQLENAFALVVNQYGDALRTLADVEAKEKVVQDPAHALLLACRSWWEGHRPIAFTIDEHLKNPQINTSGDAEKLIAQLVAAAIIDGRIERGEEYVVRK